MAQVASCVGQAAGTPCLYGGQYYGGTNRTDPATCRIVNNLWTCDSSGSCDVPGPIDDHGADSTCKVCPAYGGDYKTFCENNQWKESYDYGDCTTKTNVLVTCQYGCGSTYPSCKPAPQPTPTEGPTGNGCTWGCVPSSSKTSCQSNGYVWQDQTAPYTCPSGQVCGICNQTLQTPTPTTPFSPPATQPPYIPPATQPPYVPPATVPVNTPTPVVPTATPTPPFSTSMCKCDGIQSSAFVIGQSVKVTGFGKVEGQDQQYAKIPTFTFKFSEAPSGSSTSINVLNSGTVNSSIAVQNASMTRYTGVWDFTVPANLDTSKTYRIQQVPNCVRNTAAVFNPNPTSVVLGASTENKGFFAELVSFVKSLFGISQNSSTNNSKTQTAGQNTNVTYNSSQSPSATPDQNLQLKTFRPANITEEKDANNCSFLKVSF